MRGRAWRSFAAPAAFLLAATLVVALARAGLNDEGPPVAKRPAAAAAAKPAAAQARVYRVRAGDTLSSIAQRTGVPVARLRQLNPKLEPTALFIGQQIRLR